MHEAKHLPKNTERELVNDEKYIYFFLPYDHYINLTFIPEYLVKRLISGPSSLKQPTSPSGIPGQNNINTMLIDEDCDITVNKMKVSLRCPISLLRISEPAKG